MSEIDEFVDLLVQLHHTATPIDGGDTQIIQTPETINASLSEIAHDGNAAPVRPTPCAPSLKGMVAVV